ncbi:MAG: ATP-binding protein [Erysipelotrichaceae bacterium]|nr:ATP-binding protein [Erysipelotrichaceae bacterium]
MEIRRDLYINRLIARMNNGMIKVITGLRRSGKSYLMNTLFYAYLKSLGVDDSHIIMVQLDSDENDHLLDYHVLGNYLRDRITDDDQYYLLLDEIQEVENFERVLNGLLQKKNADIYVTGSNSRFLSSDIKTELRGRGDEVHIYPLSFKEFCSVNGNDIYQSWSDYMVYGGMPMTLLMPSDEQKAKYLKDLFEETYIKDIKQRNKIKNVSEMEELIDVMASSIGSLANPNRISNTFKSEKKVSLDPKTIKDYLSYLENAFLLSETKRYDVKGRKYINTPLKYYFEDVGLRNARLNFRQLEEPHIMENVVYNELNLRGFNVDVGVVDALDKVNDKYINKQYEVDFIANKGQKKYYIQVAQGLSDPNKKEQELKSLRNIKDNFKKIIIRKDNPVSYIDEEGILNLNFFDFLLEKRSLDE